MSDRPGLGERAGRYVWHNRWRMVRDLVVAVAWVVVLSAIFEGLGWPTWSFYVIFFGGWLLYTSVVPSWESPTADEA